MSANAIRPVFQAVFCVSPTPFAVLTLISCGYLPGRVREQNQFAAHLQLWTVAVGADLPGTRLDKSALRGVPRAYCYSPACANGATNGRAWAVGAACSV